MDEINDNECIPNQDALTPFHPDNNSEKPALSADFWCMLDLSDQKLNELDNRHQQHKAVVLLVKKDLAQKLLHFFIVYYITFFLVLFIGACASRFIPELRQPDKLKLIIASNGIYFCFLMTLSIFYELKLKVKWYFSLGTFILLACSPYIGTLCFVPD